MGGPDANGGDPGVDGDRAVVSAGRAVFLQGVIGLDTHGNGFGDGKDAVLADVALAQAAERSRALADRLGPSRLVRLSAGVAAVTFAGALLIGQVWSAMAGFAVLGAGLSVGVPLVFTAAARLGRSGPNLALVTSAGYLGVLAGPAIIGGLAEVIGLPMALGTVVILCTMIAVLAYFVLPRRSPVAGPPAPPQEILVR